MLGRVPAAADNSGGHQRAASPFALPPRSMPDLADKLHAHVARMQRILTAPEDAPTDGCSGSGRASTPVSHPSLASPSLPPPSRRSCLADFAGSMRRLTAAGAKSESSTRETASSHSSGAPQCLHSQKVAMLIQDLNKKMIVGPYERKLDLAYKYNRPFRIASRGAGGVPLPTWHSHLAAQ